MTWRRDSEELESLRAGGRELDKVIVRLSDDHGHLQKVAADMADTLRAVLMVVDEPVTGPYPWDGGALKNQIREDLTAYDLLGLDVDEH